MIKRTHLRSPIAIPLGVERPVRADWSFDRNFKKFLVFSGAHCYKIHESNCCMLLDLGEYTNQIYDFYHSCITIFFC